LGNVSFDVAKYLLTTTAVGSFVVKDVSLMASVISTVASFGLIAERITSPLQTRRYKMEIVAAISVAAVIVAAIFALYIRHQEKSRRNCTRL